MPPLTAAQKRQKEKDKKRRQKELDEIKAEHAKFDEANGSLGAKKEAEVLAVNSLLSSVGRVCHDVPSDGNCLFHTLVDQRSLHDAQLPLMDTATMRKVIADFLEEHEVDFSPFLEETDDSASNRMQQFCKVLRQDGTWGTMLEVRAASDLFHVSIAVANRAGFVLFGTEDPSKADWVIAHYDHLFALGSHFNSTRTCSKEE